MVGVPLAALGSKTLGICPSLSGLVTILDDGLLLRGRKRVIPFLGLLTVLRGGTTLLCDGTTSLRQVHLLYL
jgi:predicted ABC-type sugar transport system permease subunit